PDTICCHFMLYVCPLIVRIILLIKILSRFPFTTLVSRIAPFFLTEFHAFLDGQVSNFFIESISVLNSLIRLPSYIFKSKQMMPSKRAKSDRTVFLIGQCRLLNR